MQKTILVTGGAGYIGSHTALLLAQHNYNVIVLDDYRHNQLFQPTWAHIIQGNSADARLLDTIFAQQHIDAVMHFAASIEVGESVKNPAAFYANNVAGTLTLLQRMLHHGVKKFIFSSSCAVYGTPEFLPLTEEHTKKPISPYGKTKLMTEMMLSDFAAAYDLAFVALRYFNAAGAYPEEGLGEQHVPETHVIPLLLRAALHNSPFAVFGIDYPTSDGTAIRDYVHVRDIAQAHVRALQHLEKGNPSDYFNLGTGQGFSVKQMIGAVEKICRTKLNIIQQARRAGDPALLVADPSKAQTILQWKPYFSELEFIISSAHAFMVQHQRRS